MTTSENCEITPSQIIASGQNRENNGVYSNNNNNNNINKYNKIIINKVNFKKIKRKEQI